MTSQSRFERFIDTTDWGTLFCLFATVVWGLLCFWLLSPHAGRNPDVDALNKVGGYVGGIFNPIAIMWLVRGFFLQRSQAKSSAETLERNTQVLSNQAAALSEQAAALMKHVNLVSRQVQIAEYERLERTEPRFVVQPIHLGKYSDGRTFGVNQAGNPQDLTDKFWQLRISNAGHSVENLRPTVLLGVPIENEQPAARAPAKEHYDVLPQEGYIGINLSEEDFAVRPMEVVIRYRRSDTSVGAQRFIMSNDGKFLRVHADEGGKSA